MALPGGDSGSVQPQSGGLETGRDIGGRIGCYGPQECLGLAPADWGLVLSLRSRQPVQQPSQSPQGNWRWTRKVKAKTATVALSDQQAELFRRAIDDHRKLEKLIDQMRVISQQVLLNSVEGPARRKRRISS